MRLSLTLARVAIINMNWSWMFQTLSRPRPPTCTSRPDAQPTANQGSGFPDPGSTSWKRIQFVQDGPEWLVINYVLCGNLEKLCNKLWWESIKLKSNCFFCRGKEFSRVLGEILITSGPSSWTTTVAAASCLSTTSSPSSINESTFEQRRN